MKEARTAHISYPKFGSNGFRCVSFRSGILPVFHVASNDGVDAISESILWVKKFESIVDEYYKEIDALIKLNDAVETSRFLRKLIK